MDKQEVFTFLPADQRVLVKPNDSEESKLKSGLILPPDTEVNHAKFGEIIETGSGEEDNPMRYRKGQRVVFSDYAGVNVAMDLNGNGLEFYKIMDQRDIMGVMYKLNQKK